MTFFIFLTKCVNKNEFSLLLSSLAAISTLYFVEHSKQSERNYLRNMDLNDFRSFGRNSIGNSSIHSNGIGLGVGGSNGNEYFNDNQNQRFRKIADFAAHRSPSQKSNPFHTQDSGRINLRQQQQLLSTKSASLIATTPIALITTSMGNVKRNESKMDTTISTPKSTTTRISTDDLEKHQPFEYDQSLNLSGSNGQNDTDDNIIFKQFKAPLIKFNSGDATTEKPLQLKSEKKVDIYPMKTEPHDGNSIAESTYILSDVDTNLIDVGQQNIRNVSSK